MSTAGRSGDGTDPVRAARRSRRPSGPTAIDPDAPRSRRYRPAPPEEVVLPRGADARHGLPAPGLLHPDLQGAVGRDPHRPRPARDAGRPARRVRRPGPAPAVPDGSTPTWRTTCCVRAEADDLGDLKALRLGEADRARPAHAGPSASAATPSSWTAARSASAWSPTIDSATSRPPRSSPPARPPGSPRSASTLRGATPELPTNKSRR